MQWVKANLNLVITIAIGVLGITGLALGVVMSDVSTKMHSDEGTLSSLSSIRGSNAGVIEEVRKHTDEVKKKLDDALKNFESIGVHTPILADVFPKVPANNPTLPYKFGPAYTAALNEMRDKLHAKDAPSNADVEQARRAIEDEKAKAERASKLGADPNLAKSRPAGIAATHPVVRPSGTALVPTKQGPLTPEDRVRTDERVRASVKRAREIYCYASPNTFMLPELLTKEEAPGIESMWYSQMILWIEQDVVEALASVNNAAAEKLPAGEKPWVGNLPVKHLFKIIVGNYLLPATAVTGTGNNAAFTNHGIANRVDVIQFTVDVYLDAQSLPMVIKAISKMGFYTPLLVNYEAEPPSNELVGYIYGPQPVIHATLQFEGCFLRSKYEKLIPATVVTAIAEGKAGLSMQSGGSSPIQPGPRGVGGGPPSGSGRVGRYE